MERKTIRLETGNLFEQALTLFEEALAEYHTVMTGTPRYMQEQINEAREKYDRKRAAITDYVASLEAERQSHLDTLIKLRDLTPPRLRLMQEEASYMREEGDR